MPQWVMREYLARRGNARFKPEQIRPARCPLLGHAIFTMQVEGTTIPRWFLEVNSQPEVGDEGYDAGARILYDFFQTQLKKFSNKDLDPLGRKIIDCCLAQGTIDDYADFIPQE